MTPRIAEPATDGQLYDLLQRLFGIGDWHSGDPIPWHKARGNEIAKIRAIKAKRALSYADWTLLADYCSRRRTPVRKAWDLLEHFPAALREKAANRRPQLDLDIEAAVAIERQWYGETEWVDRLLRASGPGRTWALEAWKSEREELGDEHG